MRFTSGHQIPGRSVSVGSLVSQACRIVALAALAMMVAILSGCGGGGTATVAPRSATGTPVISNATPNITWAAPAAINYGATLSASQLNATANMPGTFVYAPAAGTVLAAGSQTLMATFTPTDATDYATATANVTLTVNKATPTIIWTGPAAITYGTALGPSQLNATASVPGTFVYAPAAGTALSSGSQTLTTTFTPTDVTDYNTAAANVTLTVNATAPGALTPNASNLNFNNVNTGSNSVLSVTFTNFGSSNIAISNVTISGPGFIASGVSTGQIVPPTQTATLNVTFTPTGTGSVTGGVTITSNASNSPASISLSGTGVSSRSYSVSLNWIASPSSVSGYNVYRALVTGGPYLQLNSSVVTTIEYQDTNVQLGQTYYYVVNAVDLSGDQSPYSNQTIVSIPIS